jgi:hypothetical protein
MGTRRNLVRPLVVAAVVAAGAGCSGATSGSAGHGGAKPVAGQVGSAGDAAVRPAPGIPRPGAQVTQAPPELPRDDSMPPDTVSLGDLYHQGRTDAIR